VPYRTDVLARRFHRWAAIFVPLATILSHRLDHGGATEGKATACHRFPCERDLGGVTMDHFGPESIRDDR